MKGEIVEASGISLELVKRGTGGVPLLFLHPHLGLLRSAPFIEALATRFTVYAPSHPGFGRSALPRHVTTVDDLAYLYLDLIEALDLDRVVLVGSSFGGWLAAEIAVKASPRLARLVLIDPVGVRFATREESDIADIFTMKQSRFEELAYHDPAIAAIDHAALSEEDAVILFRNRESTARFAWSPYMNNPKLRGRLHRIRVPTLLLWGAADGIVKPSYGEAYAGLIPGASFAIIARAGHFPHIEEPAAVADRIIAFGA
ncbi:MAG: alpha/beta fold hydrolase [Stellaceae bacterium]